METLNLTFIKKFEISPKVEKQVENLKNLLEALEKREITGKVVELVNEQVLKVNHLSGSNKEIGTGIDAAHQQILEILRKEMNLTPENYYTYLWMGVGTAAFGLPLGIIFGLLIGNIGMMAIGLPFGVVIGMLVGKGLDRKAKEEGRILELGPLKHE